MNTASLPHKYSIRLSRVIIESAASYLWEDDLALVLVVRMRLALDILGMLQQLYINMC